MNYPRPVRPIVTIGLNDKPDGVIHYLPYTFGVRAPYENPPPGSPQAAENEAYGRGAYDAGWRVGAAGLITGLSLGILGILAFRPKRRA